MSGNDSDVSVLVGKTLSGVFAGDGHSVVSTGDDNVIFVVDDGSMYRMKHYQDCCETVSVEEIVGDISDLVGSPVIQAEEVSNYEGPALDPMTSSDSHSWTFYKFATAKGYVTIRWLGESNGYYSECVDFIGPILPKAAK